MEISCAAHRVQSGNVHHISEKYFRSAAKIWFQNAFSLYGGLIRLDMELLQLPAVLNTSTAYRATLLRSMIFLTNFNFNTH
ncbi:unnamed protein product [Parnassius mnemosyne]|uniref:Uncharacterized protein n=1 Tax=Parnassius mnemosyne TaxID=213953 RepID=A0AAV1LGF2_9NEOP